MKNKNYLYYYDESCHIYNTGEILEVAKDGIWGYGEEFFRLYPTSKECIQHEYFDKNITDTRHFEIHKVKPIGKVFEGENCKLATKIEFL